MTSTNIDKTETTHIPEAGFHGQDDGYTLLATEAQAETAGHQSGKGKPESELRAAARRHGLSMKELAHRMGVNAGYLSDVANGRRPWTPMMREKVMAVLGGGAGAGHRLPPGRFDNRREQLHPGAGPGEGHEPEGPGRCGGGVLRLHGRRRHGATGT